MNLLIFSVVLAAVIIIIILVKRSKPGGEKQNRKDYRKAECPYCHQALEKIPARKTKCPHCGEFMFVRTRPKDHARFVVTKEEVEQINEEWSIAMGTHDSYVAAKEEFGKEREILKKRFGKEPSENDVKWELLSKSLVKYAKNRDWGLYRNTRFEMAEILRKESKLEDALQIYLEVCYLDLNGPSNVGKIDDNILDPKLFKPELLKEYPELLEGFPPFDPDSFSSLSSGILNRIKRIIKRLEIDKEKVKDIFLTHNSEIESSIGLPLSVTQCWLSLEKEL